MLDRFAEFARREISHGGPEPELSPIVWLTQNSSDIEKVWAAGVYCSHHCVPSAMVVWRSWRPSDIIWEDGVVRLEKWLKEHWDALPVRNEMRSHRMVEKRAKCLYDFAEYTLSERWRSGTYDEVWDDSIASVKYFGRYVAIKYMEFLRRMVRPELALYDVRIASGAWSVREGLAHLFPETEPWMSDRSDNSEQAIRSAEGHADLLRYELKTKYNLELSFFDIQVLLCEFKQWSNGTFYPGVSHDEELEFARRVETDFDIPEFWAARQALFPASALGEIGGWNGKRRDQYDGKRS